MNDHSQQYGVNASSLIAINDMPQDLTSGWSKPAAPVVAQLVLKPRLIVASIAEVLEGEEAKIGIIELYA